MGGSSRVHISSSCVIRAFENFGQYTVERSIIFACIQFQWTVYGSCLARLCSFLSLIACIQPGSRVFYLESSKSMALPLICRSLSSHRLLLISKRLFSSSSFMHPPRYRRPHSFTRFISPSAAVASRLTPARFITGQTIDLSDTPSESIGGDGEDVGDLHPPDQSIDSSETPFSFNGTDAEPEFHLHDKYFPGCDFEHWLVVMDSPGGEGVTEEQKSDYYVQTLAKALGSEEEAKKKIYNVSVDNAFGCAIDEETSNKLQSIPGVRFILPDNAVDAEKKDDDDEKCKQTKTELTELVSGLCEHLANCAVKPEADNAQDPNKVAEAKSVE